MINFLQTHQEIKLPNIFSSGYSKTKMNFTNATGSLNIVDTVATMKTRFTTILKKIVDFPLTIRENTVEATDNIADKLGEYRKAMKGEGQDNQMDDGGFLMDKSVMELLKDVKSTNPALYCLLISAGDCWKMGQPHNEYLKCGIDVPKCSLTDRTAINIFVMNLVMLYNYSKTKGKILVINPANVLEIESITTIFDDEAKLDSFFSRLQ